ncbi:sodium:calcium antiporter [Natronococcus jeotgali]|uniref:Sodium/calcium exchanger membrane protein n=1 Tax=Natronococcus jeotgali DSM 18795 TaxID=1227498 RepID=L9WR89_9EURY|nr:sodium/calcium exchanger membrane protein [Natronococcus jeotgali]ELY50838.1 sodium/calcium exchanger membrane protein [Natronococcus jeotgali DSM 18795]
MTATGVGVGLAAALFLVGVALVIWCVEVFIEAVARSAVAFGISGFFLAVVLAGIDLENAVLGLTAAGVALPDLALGTVFGEALFVLTVAVGLAGLLVPFEPRVPRAYLGLLLAVPIPAFAMSLDGTIGRARGAVLLAAFVPLLAAIFWRERGSETAYLLSGEVAEVVDREDPQAADLEANGGAGERAREAEDGGLELPDLDADEFVPDLEDRSGPFALGVAALATVGLTAGSLLTVVSAEQLFVAAGISGLAFGATVLSFVASIEELALTLEPVRRGQSHLAVGNVVGSTVFYLTANVGLIALVRPIDAGGAVLTVHWPALAAGLLVVTAMLARGRVTRGGGAALLGLYVLYWVLNYV